ncbi:MAG: FtsQ-type POTRA domain-containing protein [Bradymonadales bacterium]|nr:FtsQ-type POTRA domain-containing protein [Bradymonadales bacterium]
MGWLRRKNRRKRTLGQRATAFGRMLWTTLMLTTRLLITVALIASLPVGIYYAYHALMVSPYFLITSIQLTGNEMVDREEILTLAGLDQPRNLLTVDGERVEHLLLANPWIVSASVERELPRTLHVDVTERQPAGWLFYGELFRIDGEGVVIEAGRAAEVDGPLITGIEPVLRGDQGQINATRVQTALRLAERYRELELDRFDELVEVHFDELLGFSLLTRNNAMEIRIGEDRFEQRLNRLADVFVTMDGEPLIGRYVLLDGEYATRRVAVGPVRPGRGGHGPGEAVLPSREDGER